MTTLVRPPRIKDDFIFDPSLALYLPLYELDRASFMSKDAYGHLCTVTGALWTPRGRSFDGVDDKIVVNNHASFTFAKTDYFSIEAWAKSTDTTQHNCIIGKTVGAGYFVSLYHGEAGELRWLIQIYATGYKYRYGGTNVGDGEWYHFVATYDGSDTLAGLKLYVDGAEESYTGAESGTIGDMASATDLYIGMRSAADLPFNGSISDVRIYSRALTPLEIQRNYLATKWRYQ